MVNKPLIRPYFGGGGGTLGGVGWLAMIGGFEKRQNSSSLGELMELGHQRFSLLRFLPKTAAEKTCWDILQGGPHMSCNRANPFIRPFKGFITLFITGRGPLCIIYSSKIPDPQPKNITPHIRQLKKIPQLLSGSLFFPTHVSFYFVLQARQNMWYPWLKAPGKPWQFPN